MSNGQKKRGRPKKKLKPSLDLLLQEREKALNICQTSLETITSALATANSTIETLSNRIKDLEKEKKLLEKKSTKPAGTSVKENTPLKTPVLDVQVDGTMIKSFLDSILRDKGKHAAIQSLLFQLLNDESLPELASFFAHKMMGKTKRKGAKGKRKISKKLAVEE